VLTFGEVTDRSIVSCFLTHSVSIQYASEGCDALT